MRDIEESEKKLKKNERMVAFSGVLLLVFVIGFLLVFTILSSGNYEVAKELIEEELNIENGEEYIVDNLDRLSGENNWVTTVYHDNKTYRVKLKGESNFISNKVVDISYISETK